MTSTECVQNIERVLSKLEGVKSATVNLTLERAQVEYDSSRVSPADMISAIKGIGYTASLKADKKMLTSFALTWST
ncbi:MAG: heavy-metal-associated domain-containing protein [Methanosarcinaceae archaeon]|nr:heavy-metal-associated domain-containing protein [Methanosarcinaceae archaeon]